MLKNVCEDKDLVSEKADIIQKFGDLLQKHKVKILDDEVYEFNYPVEAYPEKVSSLNFDKKPEIKSKLMV